jgi:hypothetical protein
VEHGLEHQCGLPDAGFATDQYQRSGYQPASQHPVQLLVVHVDAGFFICFDLAQGDGFGFGRFDARYRTFIRNFLADNLFYIGIPFATRRTFAHPFG